MIDTNELRRLAQEAMHPVTKGRWMRLFGERTVYDRMEDGCRGIPVVSTPVSPPRPFEAACLDFIAAANPAAVIELLDRLEAAEKERDNYKSACNEWAKKTEWVQCGINDGSVPPRYLGWHRVDVIADLLSNAEKDIALKERIIDSIGAELNAAEQERDELRAELKTAHAQMMTSVVAEREACAKVCEKLTKPSHPVPGHPIDAWLLATLDCAKVIRARGK